MNNNEKIKIRKKIFFKINIKLMNFTVYYNDIYFLFYFLEEIIIHLMKMLAEQKDEVTKKQKTKY